MEWYFGGGLVLGQHRPAAMGDGAHAGQRIVARAGQDHRQRVDQSPQIPNRRRGNQAKAAQRVGQPLDERGEHGAVCPVQVGSGVRAAEHGDLVPEDEQFDVICLHNARWLIGKLEHIGPAGLETDLALGSDHLSNHCWLDVWGARTRAWAADQRPPAGDCGDQVSDRDVRGQPVRWVSAAAATALRASPSREPVGARVEITSRSSWASRSTAVARSYSACSPRTACGQRRTVIAGRARSTAIRRWPPPRALAS